MNANIIAKITTLVLVIARLLYIYIYYSSLKTTHTFPLWANNILFKNVPQCAIILHACNGGLGSRLFMFGSAYVLSLYLSCQLYIDSDIIKKLRQSLHIFSSPFAFQ